MSLQLLHSEFPYIWGKFDFLFYQCTPHQLTQPECPHIYLLLLIHPLAYSRQTPAYPSWREKGGRVGV
jgi:hypothetical protein